mgnify:CR=1 FL=1
MLGHRSSDETPFVPARGRSRFEYDRDKMLCAGYASVTTRNTSDASRMIVRLRP